MILIEGVSAEVVEVMDALDLHDISVTVWYEGEEGGSYMAHERLGKVAWERDLVPGERA